MNALKNMNGMALGCIVAGLAGAFFALGDHGSANATAQPGLSAKTSDMCVIAASFSVSDPALAKQMRGAIGCAPVSTTH